MSFRDDENDKKDDGSVWTSYSDMFTTMAVIFLVMFVFALLRSGVSTLTMVKQKKEQQEQLKGKIPEKVVKENQEKKQKLQDSIHEMDQFNDLINEKLAKINTFSKKMQDHKNSMEHLLADQAKKEAIVGNLREEMQKRDHKLVLSQQEVGQLKRDLSDKVSDLEKSLTKNRELKQKESELAVQVQNWEEQVIKLKDHLEKQNREKLQKISQVESHLNQKIEENQQLAKSLADEQLQKQDKITALRNLEVQREEERKKLIEEMALMKNEKESVINGKNHELNKLTEELRGINSQKEEISRSLAVTIKQKMDGEQKVASLSDIVKQLEENLNRKKSDLSKLGNSLSNSDNVIARQTKQLEELKSDLKTTDSNNEALNQVIKNLNEDIKTANNEVSKLKNDLINRKSTNKELDFKLKNLNQELAESKNKNQFLKSDNLELSKNLDERINLNKNLQKELAENKKTNLDLENQINNLGFNVDGLQKQITSKEQNIKNLKTELTKLEEKNSDTLLKNSSLNGMVKTLKKQIGTLEYEVDTHKSEQVILKQNLAGMKSKYKSELEKNHQHEQKISEFKSQVNDLHGKLRGLKDSERSLKDQLADIKAQKGMKESENGSLNEKLAEIQGKYQQTLLERKGLEARVSGLNDQIQKIQGEKGELQGKLAGLQSKLEGDQAKNSTLNNKVADFQEQINNMNQKMINFKYRCESEKAEKAEKERLMEKVSKLESTPSRVPASIPAHDPTSGKLQELEKANKEKENKITQLLSKQRFLEVQLKAKPPVLEKATETSKQIALKQKTLRQHIGNMIAKRLIKEGLNVSVDPSTGSVILRMDNAFTFKRNSAKLNPKAKETLQKIIPLYAEEIFKDSEISSKIHNINIVGHASPQHRQKFIDPNDTSSQRAYNFNLDLSSDRAREIVKFIFTNSFGNFSHKSEFRRKVQAIGKSFSEPVVRGPASVRLPKNHPDFCGKYDCKLSRRVEIAFTLKDDKEVWEKIQNIQERRP